MLNVVSSNSNNFVLTSEENHNRSKLSAKSKVQLKSNTFLQAKVPALNLPASTVFSSRQQPLSPPQQPAANPVIIIHQNNSISSNVEYLNNLDTNNNQNHLTTSNLKHSTNSMESSSFTSTSSAASTSNVDMVEQQTSSDYTKEDLKYMKGYVNVLKERFTRRSLGSNAFEQIPIEQSSVQHSNQAIRLSISDYQRRKMQTSGMSSSSRVIASQNDYQRRRSASPFMNREVMSQHFNNFSNNSNSYNHSANNTSINTNNTVKKNTISSNKYSKDVCTNLESKSIYTKKTKKPFASSDDLCDLQENDKVKTNRLINSTTVSSMTQSLVAATPDDTISNLKPTKKSDQYLKSRRSCNNVDQLVASSSSDTCPLPSYSSMSQLNSTNAIIKCTYMNEINKDELPKPNFVSSVKNLFERQISNNAAYTSHSSISSISPSQYSHTQQNNNFAHINEASRHFASPKVNQIKPIPEESPKTPVRYEKSHTSPSVVSYHVDSSPQQTNLHLESVSMSCASSSSMQQSPDASVENLVDRMKHNGTLVYDHTNLINSPDTIGKQQQDAPKLPEKSPVVTLSTVQLVTTPIATSVTVEPVLTTPDKHMLKKQTESPSLIKIAPLAPNHRITTTPLPSKPESSALQTLSFKERKEIFNKQNLIYSTSNKTKLTPDSSKSPQKDNTTPSPPSMPSQNKRQKIEIGSPAKPTKTSSKDLLDLNTINGTRADDVNSKTENKENNNMNESPSNKVINKMNTKNFSEDLRKQTDQHLGDTTNSLHSHHYESKSPITKKKDDNDGFMDPNLPSATEILNSATEAQQAKNKLKSATQVKLKTFYGGEVIKDMKSLNLTMAGSPLENGTKKASFRLNPSPLNYTVITSQSDTHFEFIGAYVKLEKSNLSTSNIGTNFSSISSGTKKSVNFRVNFKESAETFEYPSYEFLLKEMGIDPLTDPDYQIVPNENSNETLSFNNFLPGNMSPSDSSSHNDYYDNRSSSDFFNSENENSTFGDNLNATKFTKGSFTNFKPSWHNTYELGSVENFEILQPINQNTKQNDSFLTNDILPTKEEDLKRWSTDMDSNILF